jgi:hypothetical protein
MLGGYMQAAFLFLMVCVASPPLSARETPVGFDWVDFGKTLRRNLQPEIKRATPLMQIHYLTEQTAEKLWVLGVSPNYDQAGRDRAQRQFAQATLGTCGHTAQCVQQVWRAAGVGESVMVTAVVLKRRSNGQVPPELNADHAAMVYLHPDGPIVFDLWYDGRERQSFAHFRSSVWRGMPLGEWGRRMALEGYTVAAFQEHPELGETTPYEFAELVRRLSSRHARGAAASPLGKTATSRMK